MGRRRRRLVSQTRGMVLGAGIGTGRNLEYYPTGPLVTGIDVAPRMLDRARRRAARLGGYVHLELADAQHLPFPDRSFDTVVATCVFCSVPDPVRRLAELGRFARTDGQILLLEHVRPRGPLLGWVADRLSPLTRRFFGFNLKPPDGRERGTAGLEILRVGTAGIWREIEARPGSMEAHSPEADVVHPK